MVNKAILGIVVIAAVGGLLYYSSKKVQSIAAKSKPVEVPPPIWNWNYDQGYREAHHEFRSEIVSTDNFGGTFEHNTYPVAADYPTFTGGTYLHPDVLPPVRTYRLQGGVVSPPTQYLPEVRRLTAGRFVNPTYLPPTREYSIQRGGPMRRTGSDRRREEQ